MKRIICLISILILLGCNKDQLISNIPNEVASLTDGLKPVKVIRGAHEMIGFGGRQIIVFSKNGVVKSFLALKVNTPIDLRETDEFVILNNDIYKVNEDSFQSIVPTSEEGDERLVESLLVRNSKKQVGTALYQEMIFNQSVYKLDIAVKDSEEYLQNYFAVYPTKESTCQAGGCASACELANDNGTCQVGSCPEGRYACCWVETINTSLGIEKVVSCKCCEFSECEDDVD